MTYHDYMTPGEYVLRRKKETGAWEVAMLVLSVGLLCTGLYFLVPTVETEAHVDTATAPVATTTEEVWNGTYTFCQVAIHDHEMIGYPIQGKLRQVCRDYLPLTFTEKVASYIGV
jgi:hypothetical protein